MSSAAILKDLARRFARYRARLITALALTLASAILTMISPILLREVIDTALPQHYTALLVDLCLTMILCGIMASLVSVGQFAISIAIGQQVVQDLRQDVYDAVQQMPVTHFAAESNGQVQSVIANDIGGVSDILSYSLPGLSSAFITLLASLTVMVILSWQLAVVALALSLGLNFVNNRFARRRRVLGRERQSGLASILQIVGEDLSLSGIILGRTLDRSDWQRERFLKLSSDISEITYRQRLAGRTAYSIIGMALACLPPLIYLLSGTMLPGLTLGTVVVIAWLQARISLPIQQLMELSGAVQGGLAMYERAAVYLDLNRRSGPGPMRPGRTRPERMPVPVAIALAGVSYSYPLAETIALADISLAFPPGSATLIAGESGAGKTTLALTIAGLIEPSAGAISVGTAADGTSERLRGLVTLVPQHTMLFRASMLENLRFGNPDATMSEIRSVISMLRLDSLVGKLPGGLHGSVGDGGNAISGGERQRVGIARALLAPYPVVLLDEATNALDGATARCVHDAIREYCSNRTLIIVAHRIPQMLDDDHVVILRQGKVGEYGLHCELIGTDSAYSRIVHSQQEREDGRSPMSSIATERLAVDSQTG
jgi:ATP-binding cassette, subfamily B, bacterial